MLKLLYMSDGRTGRRKLVKRAKLCLLGQFCHWVSNSYWRRLAIKFSPEPKIALQISWRTESECASDVWTWKFLNPQKKICAFKNIRLCADGDWITVTWSRKNWQSQILLFDFLNDVLRRSINYLYRSVWQIGKQLTETNNTPVSLNFIFLHL